MNEEEEAAALERLKGKIIGPNPLKVQMRGRRRPPQVREVTQPIETGHMPAPEHVDGWDPSWGARPHGWFDSDLAWHEGDEEWNPDVSDLTRARVSGRKRQAAVQRDDRAKLQDMQAALKRVQHAEALEQEQVWRTWVIAEVPLTSKQAAFLNDEVELSASSTTRMRARIHDRVRRTLESATDQR